MSKLLGESSDQEKMWQTVEQRTGPVVTLTRDEFSETSSTEERSTR